MTVFIFLMGTLVTLMVVGAITLLIWGAVLDGRTEEAERRRRREGTHRRTGPSQVPPAA